MREGEEERWRVKVEGESREDVEEEEEGSGREGEQEDEWVGEEEVAAQEAGLGGVAPVSTVFLKRMGTGPLNPT